VQVDPIKPTLKAPGSERLKLNCDILPPTSAFKSNLRRYTVAGAALSREDVVERCSLTLSNPR